MPKGTVASRVQAIEALGNAKVTVTEWGYDDTVRWTRDYAQRNGYGLVQDTVLENYHEIPQNIVLGYTTMIREVVQQIAEQALDKPTHVPLQAGVGSMAGGVLGWLADTLKARDAGRRDPLKRRTPPVSSPPVRKARWSQRPASRRRSWPV